MPRLTKRPRVPPEQSRPLLAYLRRGNSIAASAGAAGIHKDTYRDWFNRGKAGEQGYVEFYQDALKALAEAEVMIFEVLRSAMAGEPLLPAGVNVPSKKAMSGYKLVRRKGLRPELAAWWLARRNREEWAERVELSGAGGGAIQIDVKDVHKLSDDELKRLVTQHRGKK